MKRLVPVHFDGVIELDIPDDWPAETAEVIALCSVLATTENPDPEIDEALSQIEEILERHGIDLSTETQHRAFDHAMKSSRVMSGGWW